MRYKKKRNRQEKKKKPIPGRAKIQQPRAYQEEEQGELKKKNLWGSDSGLKATSGE